MVNSKKNLRTTFLFVLPLRCLKYDFSLDSFISDLNQKSPDLAVQLISFEITSTCVNDRMNGQYQINFAQGFSQTTQEPSVNGKDKNPALLVNQLQLDLLSTQRENNLIFADIIYLVEATFEGSQLELTNFYKWWLFQVFNPTHHQIITLRLKNRVNDTWLKRREQFLFGGENTIRSQNEKLRRNSLFKGIFEGDTFGNPIFTSHFGLIWSFSSKDPLNDVVYKKNFRSVKTFLKVNFGDWNVVFPANQNKNVRIQNSYLYSIPKIRIFSLQLSDFLIAKKPTSNSCTGQVKIHEQRLARCNYNRLIFAEKSLRGLFTNKSELFKLCFVIGSDFESVDDAEILKKF